jgi:hypothetical protein
MKMKNDTATQNSGWEMNSMVTPYVCRRITPTVNYHNILVLVLSKVANERSPGID